ncbi:hypothetical protein Tco_0356049 [Tanacetum coccineum]
MYETLMDLMELFWLRVLSIKPQPTESDGFHEIIDFPNANQIRYALTVNPIIYTSCIQQFWATAKENTVNGERQIQAPIDKKKVIITKSSIRSDLHLEDAGDSDIPADSLQTPITTQPSSSRSQKKQSMRKQRKDIEDIDKDADVSLVDDTQGRSNDEKMFDINDLHGDEVNVDMPVGKKQEQSAKEREVNTSVEDSAAPTTIKEITLAQTLIQIKAVKPKVVTTASTTTTTTRPKARGVVVQEPSEFRTPQESQPSITKDKGKAIMIEPEVPLKRKDQVALDEDLARNLQAYLEAELIEEERLARK